MNILIIANFTQNPEEKGNNRFNYIANLLAKIYIAMPITIKTFKIIIIKK